MPFAEPFTLGPLGVLASLAWFPLIEDPDASFGILDGVIVDAGVAVVGTVLEGVAATGMAEGIALAVGIEVLTGLIVLLVFIRSICLAKGVEVMTTFFSTPSIRAF